MDHVQKVAIVLNNVAVKLLRLDDDQPAATAIEAVKTLHKAMELMRLVTAPTSSSTSASSSSPRAPSAPHWHNGRAIRRGGDALEYYDANTTTTRIMTTTMAAVPIGIPDDYHHDDSMMMPIGTVSCIILYNYGLALERVDTAPDEAVHRIFFLAWQLLDGMRVSRRAHHNNTTTAAEMRTRRVMAEDDDVLQRSIVVKLTQVSHRIGMAQ
jgi:hypothetical protein